MKLKRLSAFVLVLLLLLTGCSGKPEEAAPIPTIQVVDTVGRTVEVPQSAKSICCICPFTGPFVVMFGYGEAITSTCNNVARSNLLAEICPTLKEVPVSKNSGSVNAELLLELSTDLIFVDEGCYSDDDERVKLDNLGIPYVVIGFTNLMEQMEAIEIIGKALGSDAEAESYLNWYRGVLGSTTEAMNAYSGPRPRLYHAVNEATRTDHAGSICAEWIGYLKVENVSVDTDLQLEGDKAYTSLEQIYEWAPELIICNEPGVDDYIMTDPKWAELACVKEGRVYQIPVGTSRMGHPTSTETPLALLWLSELLFPNEFEIDVRKEIYDYFETYYDYQLSEEMIDAMLSGEDMRRAKTEKPEE